MQSLSVVILQADGRAADQLALKLQTHFSDVLVVASAEELRQKLIREERCVAIVDLDLISFTDLSELCRTWGHAAVVCTHRVADEEMWAASVAAGAADCCQAEDIAGIVRATAIAGRDACAARAQAA